MKITFQVDTDDKAGWEGYNFVFNRITIVSRETGKPLHDYCHSFYPTKDSRIRPIQDYPQQVVKAVTEQDEPHGWLRRLASRYFKWW